MDTTMPEEKDYIRPYDYIDIGSGLWSQVTSVRHDLLGDKFVTVVQCEGLKYPIIVGESCEINRLSPTRWTSEESGGKE